MKKLTEEQTKAIQEFKEHWNTDYSYIAPEFTDEQILEFLKKFTNVVKAADMIADYLLSQGLADVQE